MVEKYVKVGEMLPFEAFVEKLKTVTTFKDASGEEYIVDKVHRRELEIRIPHKTSYPIRFLNIGKLYKLYIKIQGDEKDKLHPSYPKRWFAPNPMGLALLVHLGIVGLIAE